MLKPIEEFRVLSMISVTIVTFIYICLNFFAEENAYLLLILGTPSGTAFLLLLGFEFSFIPFIVFPSLIMCFSMMLEIAFEKLKSDFQISCKLAAGLSFSILSLARSLSMTG